MTGNAQSRGAWLHLRGQLTYHHEACISGTPEGLTALRDAIDSALKSGSAEASVLASDGEGYAVHIRRCRTISAMGEPPYLNTIAQEIVGYELDWLNKAEKQNRSTLAQIRREKGLAP